MRLYLKAESKNNIGYTPDWLKVYYKDNGKKYELTLDIHGDIDYSENSLDCRCKGELVPWVLWNYETGEEIDYSLLSEEELGAMCPMSKIAKVIGDGEHFVIGIYPANSDEQSFALAEDDVLSNCEALCMIYDGEQDREISFSFEAEYNGEIHKMDKKR